MSSLKFTIIAWLYKHLLKPVYFLQDPEIVHQRMLKLGHGLGKSSLTRNLVRWSFSYQHKSLEQNIVGLKFNNPVGLSAGFDKDADLLDVLPAVGFGFFQIGSVTADKYGGNSPPRLYRLPKSKSLVVNFGLKGIGAEKIITKMRNFDLKQVPISMSIAKTNCSATAHTEAGIKDYGRSVTAFTSEQLGDFYTINISCPNTFGGEPFTTPDKLELLLAHIKPLAGNKPLFIKMPIDLPWEQFKELLTIIIRHNCQGVVISNLSKQRDKLELKDSIPSHVKGSISGAPIASRANELISQTYQAYGDQLIIVGVGGIFSAADAYEKIRRGATLVQLITGMIFQGPQLIGQINEGLIELLKKDGYQNISEAIGARHRK